MSKRARKAEQRRIKAAAQKGQKPKGMPEFEPKPMGEILGNPKVYGTRLSEGQIEALTTGREPYQRAVYQWTDLHRDRHLRIVDRGGKLIAQEKSGIDLVFQDILGPEGKKLVEDFTKGTHGQYFATPGTTVTEKEWSEGSWTLELPSSPGEYIPTESTKAVRHGALNQEEIREAINEIRESTVGLKYIGGWQFRVDSFDNDNVFIEAEWRHLGGDVFRNRVGTNTYHIAEKYLEDGYQWIIDHVITPLVLDTEKMKLEQLLRIEI